MSNLILSFALLLTGTHIYAAAGPKQKLSLPEEKKRVEKVLSKRYNEYPKIVTVKCKMSGAEAPTSTLSLFFTETNVTLSNALKNADTNEGVLFVEDKAKTIDSLYIAMMQSINRTEKLLKKISAAQTPEALNALKKTLEAGL